MAYGMSNLALLLDKFPAFDPSTSDAMKARWFDDYARIVDLVSTEERVAERIQGAREDHNLTVALINTIAADLGVLDHLGPNKDAQCEDLGAAIKRLVAAVREHAARPVLRIIPDHSLLGPRPDKQAENVLAILDSHARLVSALRADERLIRQAQDILCEYLIPNGLTESDCINGLLGLLDGPQQREAKRLSNAALASLDADTTPILDESGCTSGVGIKENPDA